MKNEKSLRGTEFNGLDWTVGGKQHKNAKRLLSTIDGTPNTKDKSKNTKIACDKCGAKFNVRGKLPTHKRSFTKYIVNEVTGKGENTIITENCDGKIVKAGTVKLTEWNITSTKRNLVVKPGDKIVAEIKSIHDKSQTTIIEKTIKSIIQTTSINFWGRYFGTSMPKVTTIVWFTDGSKLEGWVTDIFIVE